MMKFSLVTVIFLVAVAVEENAYTIYTDGNIYTVDDSFSTKSSIVVGGDKIIFVGDTDEALEKYRTETATIVSLKNRTVIPGIIESHLHFQQIGETLDRIDLFQEPKAVILEKVRAEADKLDDGIWIVSRGWNNVLWEGDSGWPTKEELDAVAPRNPVALERVDGHATWYNSLALENVSKDTQNPTGGEIIKTPAGELWGILIDTATDLVPIPDDASPERKLHRFSLADQSVVSYGITTLVDAGISNSDIKILKGGYADGTIKVRAYEMLSEGDDVLYLADGNVPETDLYNGKLSINAVKIYSDGALGSRGAWLLAEYTDQPGHVGMGRWTDDELVNIVQRVSGEGFQVCTHAIGDAAVRQVIDAYVSVVGATDLESRRFRIEHFQVADPADITRTVELGIIPSMQAVHATSDMNMAETRIGPVRIQGAYAWHTIISKGGIIADGSDAPVELVNPFHGLYAAVARKARDGVPPNAWYPNEAMTREEALRSFTEWGAYASFAENLKGSLEVGKYADFVVLDRDYMTCPESEIKDILPVMTVIGGEVVFQNETTTSHSMKNNVEAFFLALTLFFFFFF